MNQQLIIYTELKELMGGSCPSELAVRLTKANIKYQFGSHGRPFTTVDALNQSMGVNSDYPMLSSNEKTTVEIEVD